MATKERPAGTLGRMMRKTRSAMIEVEAEHLWSEFTRRFGLNDGDYLEFQKATCHGLVNRVGRITHVERCFFNQRGGYTADIKVVPMLTNGLLGNTHSLTLCVNANGTGLRKVDTNPIGSDYVRRIDGKRDRSEYGV